VHRSLTNLPVHSRQQVHHWQTRVSLTGFGLHQLFGSGVPACTFHKQSTHIAPIIGHTFDIVGLHVNKLHLKGQVLDVFEVLAGEVL
jgi:hypothetical protein